MEGVVVDDVEHGPEPEAMQRLHHLPKLPDSDHTIRVAGIAALGHPIMHRIVTPVEGIPVGDSEDPFLLFLAVGPKGCQVSLCRVCVLSRLLDMPMQVLSILCLVAF